MDGSIDLCISYIFFLSNPRSYAPVYTRDQQLVLFCFFHTGNDRLERSSFSLLYQEKVKGDTITVYKYLLGNRNTINGASFNLRKKQQWVEAQASWIQTKNRTQIFMSVIKYWDNLPRLQQIFHFQKFINHYYISLLLFSPPEKGSSISIRYEVLISASLVFEIMWEVRWGNHNDSF